MGKLKRFLVPVMLLIIFEIVAVVLWLAKGELFYLLNFSYIGICLSGGDVYKRQELHRAV